MGRIFVYQRSRVKRMVETKVIRDAAGIDDSTGRPSSSRREVNMNVHLSLGHGQFHRHHERHAISDVLIVVVIVGVAFTAFSIAMTYGTGSDHPWHMLAILIGIPSALTASFFCLVRGWESLQ